MTPEQVAAYYLQNPGRITREEIAQNFLDQARRCFRSGKQWWPNAAASFRTYKAMREKLGYCGTLLSRPTSGGVLP